MKKSFSKQNKKFFIISGTIILFIFSLILLFSFAQPKFYKLYVNTSSDLNLKIDNVKGILVKSFFKDIFTLSIETNSNLSQNYGQVLYIGNDPKTRELLESQNSNYSFTRIEHSNRNGNIIKKMLKNKNNIYLCFYNKDITNLSDINDDNSVCFRVNIELIQ